MAKKWVLGASRLRRKLRRLPDEIQNGIKAVIFAEGEGLREDMKSRAPRSQEAMPQDFDGRARQHLADAIETRYAKGGLSVRVGLIGKRVMKVFYFARFLEFGFNHKRSGRHIKLPFMFPAWQARRERARASVRQATEKALQTVAAQRLPDV
jgi:hypothetical protein